MTMASRAFAFLTIFLLAVVPIVSAPAVGQTTTQAPTGPLGSQPGSVFSKVWSVPLSQYDQSDEVALSLTQLSNGNIVAAGDDSNQPNGCNPNYGGAWLVTVNQGGANVGQKLYASCASDAQTAEVVRQTSDGGFILAGGDFSNPACSSGFSSGCGWIAKLSATGVITWQEDMIYSLGAGVGDIRQTPDGGYIGVGGSGTSSGSQNGLVMKISSTGALQWVLNFSESATSFPGAYAGGELEFSSVALTSDGGYAVSGVAASHFSSGYGSVLVALKLSSAGSVQWSHVYYSATWQSGAPGASSYPIFATPDGGYVLSGTVSHPASVPTEFLLMKLDSSGNIVWQKGYGGSSGTHNFNDGATAYATSDGGFILAGQSNAFLDNLYHGWIVKTDSSGNIQWQKVYNEIQNNESSFNDIIQTSDGGYAATAWTYVGSPSYGGPGFAVLKTDSNGNIGSCNCVHTTTGTVQTLSLAFFQAAFSKTTPSISLAPVTDIVAKNTHVTPIVIYP